MDNIAVGQKRLLYQPSTKILYYIDITNENIDNINRYYQESTTEDDPERWRFGDLYTPRSQATPGTISFTRGDNGTLKIVAAPYVVDADVLAWQQAANNGGRIRSRKVKKSKTSKKRPTARRRRSSKARKARKSRSTRRR
jgi:hypothetical protein